MGLNVLNKVNDFREAGGQHASLFYFDLELASWGYLGSQQNENCRMIVAGLVLTSWRDLLPGDWSIVQVQGLLGIRRSP